MLIVQNFTKKGQKMFDFHCHTDFSDGDLSPEDLILCAIEKGLTQIGISDHYRCLPKGTPDILVINKMIFPLYFLSLRDLKEKYKDRISVKISAEWDYFRENSKETYEDLITYCPDFVIGSVHEIFGEKPVNYFHSKQIYSLNREDLNKIIFRFLEENINLAKSGKINLLAHYDLFLKFADFQYSDFYGYFTELAKALEQTGTALEINTRNGRRGLLDNDPNHFMVKECIKRQIPIVLSSDCHQNELCNLFRENMEIMKSLGVKLTCTFEKGKTIPVEFKI